MLTLLKLLLLRSWLRAARHAVGPSRARRRVILSGRDALEALNGTLASGRQESALVHKKADKSREALVVRGFLLLRSAAAQCRPW